MTTYGRIFRAGARRALAASSAMTLAALFLAWLEGAYQHASYLGALAVLGSIALLGAALAAAAPVRGPSVARLCRVAWLAGAVTAAIFGVGLILSRAVDFPRAAAGAWSADLIAAVAVAVVFLAAYVDVLATGGLPRFDEPDLRAEWRAAQREGSQDGADGPVDREYAVPEPDSGLRRRLARGSQRAPAVGLADVATSLHRQQAAGTTELSDRRRVVPNDYIVSLSAADHHRLAEELADFAASQRETLAARTEQLDAVVVGDVRVSIEADDRLPVGRWRVRTDVTPSPQMHGGVVYDTRPTSTMHELEPSDVPGAPALLVSPEEIDIAGLDARGEPAAVALGRSAVTIGSAAECKVRVPDEGVPPRLARVAYRDDAFVVESVDRHPVRVNGVARLEYKLTNGDRIEVGEHTLVFTRQQTS